MPHLFPKLLALLTLTVTFSSALHAEDPAVAAPPAAAVPVEARKPAAAATPDPSEVLEPLPEEVKKAEAQAEFKKNVVSRVTTSSTAPLPPAGGPMLPTLKPTLKIGGRMGGELPVSPEAAIILSGNQFYPARIRLKDSVQTKLYFTTMNDKPAALIIDRMQVQRWVAKEGGQTKPSSETERSKMELTRELSKNKVTEILLDPKRGTYAFYDALSGARGQMIVE